MNDEFGLVILDIKYPTRYGEDDRFKSAIKSLFNVAFLEKTLPQLKDVTQTNNNPCARISGTSHTIDLLNFSECLSWISSITADTCKYKMSDYSLTIKVQTTYKGIALYTSIISCLYPVAAATGNHIEFLAHVSRVDYTEYFKNNILEIPTITYNKPTLATYFEDSFKKGIIDFSLRINTVENGKAEFYLHPSLSDGTTIDFKVDGNILETLKVCE